MFGKFRSPCTSKSDQKQITSDKNPEKRSALILVDEVTAVVINFVRFLIEQNFEIYSAGETATALKNQGITILVSDDTFQFELVFVTFTNFEAEYGKDKTTRSELMRSFDPGKVTIALNAIHREHAIVLTGEKFLPNIMAWMQDEEPDKANMVQALNMHASDLVSGVTHNYANIHSLFNRSGILGKYHVSDGEC